VSNTDPWSYLGAKPLRLSPDCSFDRGLGLFALRSLALPTVLRHAGQILWGKARPKGKHLVVRDDVARIRVTSDKPVRVQVDGDLLGERRSVDLTAVRAALRVAA
jgi:diacylglycerol kinase family enzyme